MTDQEIRDAALTCSNMSQAAFFLKMKYLTFRAHAIRLGVWNPKPGFCTRGLRPENKIPLEEILNGNRPLYPTSKLGKRLVKEKILEYRCLHCGLVDDWKGKPLRLQLDHIDGDSYNHSLENLRFLCPNCHSQTDTYCSKNKLIRVERLTCRCGAEICKGSKSCLDCNSKDRIGSNTKITWPDTEELISRIKNSNYVQVAKELGVSDNAIRKHLRSQKKLNFELDLSRVKL